MIRSQIIALIENYDYSGAYELYQLNQDILSPHVGILLNHARKRVNLEFSEAQKILQKTNDDQIREEFKKQLLPAQQVQVRKILEYYLSMKIKQRRKELNDFVLRIEVLAEYVSIYILQDIMKISLKDITNVNKRGVYYTSQEKAEFKMPGIGTYMENYFGARGGYQWGKEINARSMMLFLTYLCEKEVYIEYLQMVQEIEKWVKVANEVRNRAAHTMDSITETMIKDAYGKGDSRELCKGIQTVMVRMLKIKNDEFEVYETINSLCKKYLNR